MDHNCLNWISDFDIINSSNINTTIIGLVSFSNKDSNTCEEIIFLNRTKYKKFSPLFAYTLKLSSKFYPDNKTGPMYFNNRLTDKCTEFWGVSKYNNYTILGTINHKCNKELYTINHKNNSMCPVSFEKCPIITKKDPCNNPLCGCHSKIKHILPSCKNNNKQIYLKSFSDELSDLVKHCKHNNYGKLKLIDFEIIEGTNIIVFAFKKDTGIKIAIFNFKINANKIIIKRNISVYDYDNSKDLIGLVYDDKKERLLILTSDKNRSMIYSIKYFKTLQALSYNIEKIKSLNKKYSSIGITKNKIILIHNNCNNKNQFGYKLLTL